MEFNKVSAASSPCFHAVFSQEPSLTSALAVPPGLCADGNHQDQLEDVPRVRPPAHVRPLRAAADPGGLPLPADVPVALRLRREPRALPAG